MLNRSGHAQIPVSLTKFSNLQKTAVRIISGSAYNAHTEPLFKSLEILPLPDLILFSQLQCLPKFTQNFLPISFSETWVRNNVRNIGENEIQLRNHDQLQFFHSNFAKLDLFPLFNYPKIWQSFPDEQIKIIRKPRLFDPHLKKFFLDDLSSQPNCNRLFCPACMTGSNS